MIATGRQIYLANHTLDNLEKMYRWSCLEELVELEGGDIDQIRYDRNQFARESMDSQIHCNIEAGEPFCHFAIHRKSNQELVGYADLQDIDYSGGKAELSLSIPEKSCRNRGYGIEALVLILDVAFGRLNLQRVTMGTRDVNKPVRRILSKLPISTEEETIQIGSRSLKLIRWYISRSDWQDLRERCKSFLPYSN